MALNPAALTIKFNRTALVLYTLCMIAGVLSFDSIGRREYPQFTIRSANIIATYPGRTAEQVELELAEVIEQALREMIEVDEVTSTSRPGYAVIEVEIDESYSGDEMEDIWTDLRNKVNEAQLPAGTQAVIVNDDFGDVYPYLYGLQGDGFSPAEVSHYADLIKDRLLQIDGVGKVVFHGEESERVFLEFSASELAERGLSPQDVAAQLQSQNAAVDSGTADFDDERIQVVTLGEFESIEELGSYRLAIPGQASSVQVSDLFEIRRGYEDPPSTLSHFNGKRVHCIAISMVEGGVVTKIGEEVDRVMGELQKTLPVGLEIERMFYQPIYVNASINNFIENLGQAFFFVVLVMLLFAGWRLAVIVGALVPSVCLFALAFMPSLDVELEMMSIAALIIALGILVDNAVVVCEQILNRLNEGMDRKKAVIDSIGGLVIPLLASSATTIAAFGVIAMAPGSAAEFTFSLFAVVTLSLLGSWLLSLTIIALFCYYFLKPLKKDTLIGKGLSKLYAPYEALLRFAIRLRWTYPILIAVLTVGALALFAKVPSIFFPPNERGQFVIDFELPQGNGVLATEESVGSFENWLLQEKGDLVESVSTWIGEGGPRWYLSLSPESANPNYALLSVLTFSQDPQVVAGLIADIKRYAARELVDIRVSPKALENGPPVGDPIQIELAGPEIATLYRLRDEMVEEINQVEGMYDVRDNWGAWTKQATVDPDPVRIARVGLTTTGLADAINSYYQGVQATHYREDEESIPVLLRARGDYRDNFERLPDLPIIESETGVVPLQHVADVEMRFLPGAIHRKDTVRTITLKGKVEGRYSSEALAEIQPRLTALMESDRWEEGYTVNYNGENAESAEAQANIASGMPLPMACLALILIAQFNSIRRFAVIIFTIPPMMIGVVPGLLVTGSSFGFMTLLGLIALLGIIVNNAILLIDEINLQLAKGHPTLEDVLAEAAKSRLRPILMTTTTTVIGLLPLALGGGGMWSSMAWAMIFGLAFATALTLLLCPILFFLFFQKSYPPQEA
ncbi:MAG: efflux RND transporter permease subunit [Verrucomicrobiota bacterium]